MRIGLAALLVGAVLAAGCGSQQPKPARTTGQAGPSAARLDPADSLAYVQLARASGALRASSAAAAVGGAPRLADRAALTASVRTVGTLRPRDSGLVALRGDVRSALGKALAAPADRRSQHAAAVAAIAATDTINRALRRFADRHPAVAQLVPD